MEMISVTIELRARSGSIQSSIHAEYIEEIDCRQHCCETVHWTDSLIGEEGLRTAKRV